MPSYRGVQLVLCPYQVLVNEVLVTVTHSVENVLVILYLLFKLHIPMQLSVEVDAYTSFHAMHFPWIKQRVSVSGNYFGLCRKTNATFITLFEVTFECP